MKIYIEISADELYDLETRLKTWAEETNTKLVVWPVAPDMAWADTLVSGIDELLVMPPTVIGTSPGSTLGDMVQEHEIRVKRKADIKLRWGILANLTGRVLGSLSRAATAMKENIGRNSAPISALYPGWRRHLLNFDESDPPLARSILIRDTFVMWPLFGTLLGLAVFLVLWFLGYPALSVLIGLGSGLGLSIVGSQPCAATVSLAGTGLGSIFLAGVFGVCNGIVLALGLQNQANTPAAVEIVMGLVGSKARPLWDTSHFLFAAILFFSFAAIAGAAWAMRGPNTKTPANGTRPKWRIIVGLLCCMVGGALGAVIGLSKALGNGNGAVTFVVGTVCALGFGVSAWLETGKLKKAIYGGVLHGCLVAALVLVACTVSTPTWGVLLKSACTGVLNGTIFTLAFLAGKKIAGPNIGAWAAGIEGSMFIVFVILRLFE